MSRDHMLDTDESDFYLMMRDQDPVLAGWVLGKLRDGKGPRDVASLLGYYAKHTQGWCTGRYGDPRRRLAAAESQSIPCLCGDGE